MIELTFQFPEEAISAAGNIMIKLAPEDSDPIRREAVRLVMEEMLKGEDKDFRIIRLEYTPSLRSQANSIKNIAMGAVLHKASEIMYKNYQPHKAQ